MAQLPPSFSITERPDGFDYVISIDAMLTPSTPDVFQKHSSAENYRAAHPGVVIRETSLSDPELRSDLKDIDTAWQSRRRNGNGDLTRTWERQAFFRCMVRHAEFPLNVLAAFDEDGAAIGFTINENHHNGYYTGHFGKTRPGHEGLSELLEMETAKIMREYGCRFMNFQEDHGIPALRRMKQSWNPCRMLRVFDASPAK